MFEHPQHPEKVTLISKYTASKTLLLQLMVFKLEAI
jgi:hypothetical protein